MASPRRRALAMLPALLVLGSALALSGCKKKPTCDPDADDNQFSKIRVVVQPAAEINIDPEGTPQPTSLRIYQIKGGRSLDVPLDFEKVWENAAEAFGDEMLKEEELTIYPGKADVFEIEPEEDATHLVAAAIFREPVGSTWYSEWEVPKFHGDSVCIAKLKKPPQTVEDPCFLIFMENSQIDGGHKPPPGMDDEAIAVACPPPPLKVKPPPPGKKKKKKKKGKLKDKAEGAQDKGADAQDKAGQASDANDKAQGAGDAVANPEAPSVPGKD